jgi:hypothetical protein
MKVLGDPVPNYNRDGHEWTFDFTPDADAVAELRRLKVDHKLKNKGDERENFLTLKQRAIGADGKPYRPITVVDGHNRLWDPEVKIGNGSTVEVKLDVVDYGKAKAAIARYGLYPIAIRVLDHKPYVRQEFAPLPEDSKYYDNFNEAVEDFGDGVVEGDPLEG